MARILYLDDEEALVFLVTRMLGFLGHEGVGHTSAPDALAAFRHAPASFDAVLTDLSMPGMNGLAFAREVLALQPQAVVAIASGFVEPVDRDEARAHGIAVVTKPGSLEELESVIATLLPAGGPGA
jgi:two-component system cell cycle sensor histidine kinase/response regulator CckA